MTTEPKRLQQHVLFNHAETIYEPQVLEAIIQEYQAKSPSSIDKKVVKAVVINITAQNVMLDLHAKADGIIPRTEFKDIPNLKIGDEVEVYVEQQESVKGEIVVSRKSAQLIKAWEALREAHKTEKILRGLVKRKIKGGLVLDIFGIEVFLPGSQINTVQTTNFDEYIGKTIEVVVAKINERKDNIVVSRKILIEKEQAKQREDIIKGLEKGQVLSGTIKNITHFGLFINLGGIVGMLHKRDIAFHKKIDDLTQLKNNEGEAMFEVDQVIEVVIKDFDLEKSYISLSTKMLTWSKLPEDVVIGSRVQGVVKEIADYYALVEIIEGVTGLLHISEMSHSNSLKHPTDVIALNQTLELQVLDIDRESQDLRLGLKQLTPDPWETETVDKYTVGQRYKGKVCGISKNGVYVTFESGIEGFLPKKHLSWTQKIHDIEARFEEEQALEVMVVEIDRENRLLVLSVRDFEENPWPSFKKTFTPGSVHKGSIIKRMSSGVIVELEQGLQVFVTNKDISKKDSKKPGVGTTLSLYVVDFNETDQKLLLCRVKEEQNQPKDGTSSYKASAVNNTLDLQVLRELKEELAQKEKKERKKMKKK